MAKATQTPELLATPQLTGLPQDSLVPKAELDPLCIYTQFRSAAMCGLVSFSPFDLLLATVQIGIKLSINKLSWCLFPESSKGSE
jgi:hypothetical protein